MVEKKLIECNLAKSYKGLLDESLNGVLFQNVCETTLEQIKESEKLHERLEISPQGEDKIDELEEALKHLKFELEAKTDELIKIKSKANNLYNAVCKVYDTTHDYSVKEKLDKFIGMF